MAQLDRFTPIAPAGQAIASEPKSWIFPSFKCYVACEGRLDRHSRGGALLRAVNPAGQALLPKQRQKSFWGEGVAVITLAQARALLQWARGQCRTYRECSAAIRTQVAIVFDAQTANAEQRQNHTQKRCCRAKG
jgi:hypothetical protein